ncbi:MAG: hypothetical protein JW726_04555 [Anaerolineales bacterium]|nr:hypothetical protein [Anaerolineales bacterium]
MTIENTHPCPKCGQMSLVYDGMLAWTDGHPRPPRHLASKNVTLSPRGNQEREDIYHCSHCGAEFFQDLEFHRQVHLWEVKGKKYLHDSSHGWYTEELDPATHQYIKHPVTPQLPSPQPLPSNVTIAIPPGLVIQPTTLEVIPNALLVHRYQHEIPGSPNLPCWTYITQGLEAFGQKELILTARRDAASLKSGTDYDFLLRPIRAVFDLFKAGKLVDEGDHTAMMLTDQQRKLGIPFNFLYLRPIPLAGISLPKQALTVRLMRPEELEVYKTFGFMRLISSWASHEHYFPYPPWSDIPAPDIVSLKRFQQSILNKVGRIFLHRSTVCLEQDNLIWRIPPSVPALLVNSLASIPPERGLAFLSGYPDGADSCLAWNPEQKQLIINLPAGSLRQRLAGCFILFVPEQQSTAIQVFEDGFAVMLPTADWLQIRRALLEGQPFRLPSAKWSLEIQFQLA